MNRKYLRIQRAADDSQISPWTVRRWLTDGKLTRYKMGGVTLVDQEELRALIRPETPAQAAARNFARVRKERAR
jgi:hypothetical protein